MIGPNLLLAAFTQFPRFYTSYLRGQSWRNLKMLCCVRALLCVKRICLINTTYFLSLIWPSPPLFITTIFWQGNVLSNPSDHKPSLLALTANGWLYRLSAETGEELQKVYLSPYIKFRCVNLLLVIGKEVEVWLCRKDFYMTVVCRYLGWDVSQETFYIKSVQNKETSLERQVRTFCFSLKDFFKDINNSLFFIFPGWYHSKHSDALGYLSCFSIAYSGDFRDQ